MQVLFLTLIFEILALVSCSNSSVEYLGSPNSVAMSFSSRSDSPLGFNALKVAAGLYHTCAITDDGVKCWGQGTVGQGALPTLNHPSQISAGYMFSCALTDGGVKCWGDKGSGKTTVPALNQPVQISTGSNHACATTMDGIKCWGNNNHGQTSAPELNHPTQVSAGYEHTCAITEDGVKCWGNNLFGRLKVPILNHTNHVSAGGLHTCALTDDGVKCWGYNNHGQADVPFLQNPIQISTGESHSCALTDDGVKCWGSNSAEQSNVPMLNNPRAVFAGKEHSCALTDDGLRCWGIGKASIVPQLERPLVDVTRDEVRNPASCSSYSANCSFHDKISQLDWSKAIIKKRTWFEARDYCINLILNHYNDWRLPTGSELLEGVSHRIYEISDPNFVGDFSGNFWSSHTSFTNSAWHVKLANGDFGIHSKENDIASVICVRDP